MRGTNAERDFGHGKLLESAERSRILTRVYCPTLAVGRRVVVSTGCSCSLQSSTGFIASTRDASAEGDTGISLTVITT
jgi:hypothetical protein